jgi:hypothetical protein
MNYYAGISKVFCVSYDLKQPGRDYSPLIDALKESSQWWHYLDSTWLIKTTETSDQVWARLSSKVDKNDFMLIIEVRNNSNGWLPKEAWDWIRTNVPAP